MNIGSQGYVTGDIIMTRNQRYEKRMKDNGLEKITLWVPSVSSTEFKQMADFCTLNKDAMPAMCRSRKTGQLVKID
jgi:hypothetical protein